MLKILKIKRDRLHLLKETKGYIDKIWDSRNSKEDFLELFYDLQDKNNNKKLKVIIKELEKWINGWDD